MSVNTCYVLCLKFHWPCQIIRLVYLLSYPSRHDMFLKLIYLMLLIFTCYGGSDDLMERRGKIVIDNDAGGDDAMAIFLALLYEQNFNGPKLVALTTANGNTDEEKVCLNNQRILKKAKRQDVPIYRGAKASMVTTPVVDDYYGKDGLGDIGEVISDLVPEQSDNAVTALIDLSKKYKDELTVITIGSLTNVALTIKMDPDFIDRIGHLYVGAGHIHDDDFPDAEFNAHVDVEAYHVVAENAKPEKVTYLPFSQVQKYLNLTRQWREEVLGAIDTEIMKAQNLYEQVALKFSDRWQALDPAVIAAVVKPDLIQEYKYSKHNISLCGPKRGIVSNEFVEKKDANARIIYSIKEEEYKQFLLDVFNSDKQS